MSSRAMLTAFLDLKRQHPYEAQREHEGLSDSFSTLYRAILDDCVIASPATSPRIPGIPTAPNSAISSGLSENVAT